MPALSLNGITVPVALNSWERPTDVRLGAGGRGTSGRMESAVRAKKGTWRGRTTPVTAATALAFRGLLQGQGHSWSFDAGLYSARGLGPSSGAGSIGAGKYGSGLIVAPQINYPVAAGTSWTVMGWRRNGVPGFETAWRHYVAASSGAVYRDGVLAAVDAGFHAYTGELYIFGIWDNAGLSPWAPFTTYSGGDKIVTDADVVFRSSSGTAGGSDTEPDWNSAPAPGDEVEEDPGGAFGGPWIWVNYGEGNFDDVVYLPYVIPAAWIPQVYAEMNARAWTPQPNLRLAGDLLSARTVRGRVAGAQSVAHKSAGALERGGEALAFELLEAL